MAMTIASFLNMERNKLCVKVLREYISFHFSTLVMGSIDKACEKEQVDYWVLDWIGHLCVAGTVWSAAFSLATCSQR